MFKKIIFSFILIIGSFFWENFLVNQNNYNNKCFNIFNIKDEQKQKIFSFEYIEINFNIKDHNHTDQYEFVTGIHFYRQLDPEIKFELSYRFGPEANKVNNVVNTDKNAYSNKSFTLYCPKGIFNDTKQDPSIHIPMYFNLHLIMYNPITNKEERSNYYILTCNLNLSTFINFNNSVSSKNNIYNINIPSLIKFDMNQKIILVNTQTIQLSFDADINNYLLFNLFKYNWLDNKNDSLKIAGSLYISDYKYQNITDNKLSTTSRQENNESQLYINQYTYYDLFTDKISSYKNYEDEDGRQGLILAYFHTISCTLNFYGYINTFINIPIKVDISVHSISIFKKQNPFHVEKIVSKNFWNTTFYKKYVFNNKQYQDDRKSGKWL